MNDLLFAAVTLTWAVMGVGCWLGWQLLRQNGRMLLRLDDLEKRLDELDFGEHDEDLGSSRADEAPSENSEARNPTSEMDQSLVTSAATSRFRNRSLARSKINRGGLKAGTPAPDFRLPSLNGRDLELHDFRGRRLLLVFSDPHC